MQTSLFWHFFGLFYPKSYGIKQLNLSKQCNEQDWEENLAQLPSHLNDLSTMANILSRWWTRIPHVILTCWIFTYVHRLLQVLSSNSASKSMKSSKSRLEGAEKNTYRARMLLMMSTERNALTLFTIIVGKTPRNLKNKLWGFFSKKNGRKLMINAKMKSGFVNRRFKKKLTWRKREAGDSSAKYSLRNRTAIFDLKSSLINLN